jgi:hypothetical protein
VRPPFLVLVDVTRVAEPVDVPARPAVDGVSCAGLSGLLSLGAAIAAADVKRLAMRTAIAIARKRPRFLSPRTAFTLVSFRLPNS